MVGRLTSVDAPSVNPHGVPYRDLYEREKESSSRLMAKAQEALSLWVAAHSEPGRSGKRRSLLQRALKLTESILS